MDNPSRYLRLITTGTAQLLADAGCGVYSPDSVYQATDRAIVLAEYDFDGAPAEQIIVTVYAETPGDLALNEVRVQVRSRVTRDPLEALDVVDRIRDALHDKAHVVFPDAGTFGVHVDRVRQLSHAYLGVNQHGQHEHTQNFRLTGNRYQA